MCTTDSPAFELRLLISYPMEVVVAESPVATSPISPHVPRLVTDMGSLYIYFDEWDVEADVSAFDGLFIHFIPSDPPASVAELFMSPPSRYVAGLFWDPNSRELDGKREELLAASRRHVDELFAEPVLSGYFAALAELLTSRARSLIEILRLDYGQYLLPDTQSVRWSSGHWILPEGSAIALEQRKQLHESGMRAGIVSGYHLVPEERIAEVAPAFLERLGVQRRPQQPSGGGSPALRGSDWPNIVARLGERSKTTELSRVLMATAHGQCYSGLGEPRLALVAAVAALEMEVKALMERSLRQYGIGKSAVDHIVRETPLSDLASVWIRREVSPSLVADCGDDVFHKAARAIRDRNELVHLQRRRITWEHVIDHVRVLDQLTTLARESRVGSDK